MVKRIAIQHPYNGVAENQSAFRIIEAAERIGIEAKEVRYSDDLESYQPDFVLSIAHQDPKLSSFPTYGVMTAPKIFYQTRRFITNLLSYDGYLTVTPQTTGWLKRLCREADKGDIPIGFYANTVTSKHRKIITDFSDADLMYIGTNWDGHRHNRLFEMLSERSDFMKIYGPERSWEHLQTGYCGFLPFDADSVIKAYQEAKVGLCLEHLDFYDDGMPSSRIYETLASGALAICSDTQFNRDWFGDNVLYVDQSLSYAQQAEVISEHMAWIRTHSDAAVEKAKSAADTYQQKLSMDVMLQNLLAYHESRQQSRSRHYEALSDLSVAVVVDYDKSNHSHAMLSKSLESIPDGCEIILWGDLDDDEDQLQLAGIVKSFRQLAEVFKYTRDSGSDWLGFLSAGDRYLQSNLSELFSYMTESRHRSQTVVLSGASTVHDSAIKFPYVPILKDINILKSDDTRRLYGFRYQDTASGAGPCWASSFINTKFIDADWLDDADLGDALPDYLAALCRERGPIAFAPWVISDIEIHSKWLVKPPSHDEQNYQRLTNRMLGRSKPKQTNTYLGQTQGLEKTHYEDPALMSLLETIPSRRDSAYINYQDYELIHANHDNVLHINLPSKSCGYFLLTLNVAEPDTGLLEKVEFSYSQSAHSIEIHESQIQIRFWITRSVVERKVSIRLYFPPDTAIQIKDAITLQQNRDWPEVQPEVFNIYTKVWFYGAGTKADALLPVLRERLGIDIDGIADTYFEGQWEGYSVVKPQKMLNQLEQDDVVIVTSNLWPEIRDYLIDHNVNCHVYGGFDEERQTLQRII